VHCTHELPIGARETAGELHGRLALLAGEALAAALPALLAGTSVPVPQNAEFATVAPKITKADAAVDWRAPAVEIERRVRAFNPWPVAEARLTDGRRLRVFEAEVLVGLPAEVPGTIVAATGSGIDVATGAGVLRLLKIQPPSARVMDVEAYLAAHSLAGTAFVV
jgi:methionyl-tRNA formyltransferase